MKQAGQIRWKGSMAVASSAKEHLPPLGDAYFAAGRHLLATAISPAEFHAFRLETKRFRYTLELFRPLYGPRLDQMLEELRRIQTVLGEFNDCAVTVRRLDEAWSHDEVMADVLAKVERRGAGLRNEFLRLWREEFDQPGEALRWHNYLARYAGRRVAVSRQQSAVSGQRSAFSVQLEAHNRRRAAQEKRGAGAESCILEADFSKLTAKSG
jgi:hypothetical protein